VAKSAVLAAIPGVIRSAVHWLSLLLILGTLTGCNTVTDMVTAHIPSPHTGKASIVVRLHRQEATLLRGGNEVTTTRISTGREGYGTPTGTFRVQRKDEDHRSSLYGDYVDQGGRVIRPNVDVRKTPRPRGARYVGASMPFFLQFKPGYGLHAGHLPGYPASHGCVRLSYWKARQFYQAARVGTKVTILR
jgi:lipoprotein-anchoring transpeptidase ErfK/SrfK